MCASHLWRSRNGKDLHAPMRPYVHHDNERCAAEDCNRPAALGDWCEAHKLRARLQDATGRTVDRYPLGAVPRTNWWREITYATAHIRVKSLWGSAKGYFCVDCEKAAACWAYDGTDPAQLLSPCDYAEAPSAWYSPFPEFYMPLCSRCHSGRDGAMRARELSEYRQLKLKERDNGLVLEIPR